MPSVLYTGWCRTWAQQPGRRDAWVPLPEHATAITARTDTSAIGVRGPVLIQAMRRTARPGSTTPRQRHVRWPAGERRVRSGQARLTRSVYRPWEYQLFTWK